MAFSCHTLSEPQPTLNTPDRRQGQAPAEHTVHPTEMRPALSSHLTHTHVSSDLHSLLTGDQIQICEMRPSLSSHHAHTHPAGTQAIQIREMQPSLSSHHAHIWPADAHALQTHEMRPSLSSHPAHIWPTNTQAIQTQIAHTQGGLLRCRLLMYRPRTDK